ncbi:MAG: PaaI family thioesterase [Lachnospiraceae bacterium]|nr:PaaI family thioesterase [Lachnospiraceae bacterium]
MSTFRSVEEARAYFKGDRYAAMTGADLLELYEDGCLAGKEVTEVHRNALGGVMGGAIFTLADYAFAVSCNQDHLGTVAINVNVNYLSAPKGTWLYARAKVLKSGRTTIVCEVTVTDDTGREVALFTGTGFKLQG